ncbi:MAG: holo-ACP synthase [Candidatus Thorarchaeota archaeon]|nr:holo-ACP synthase [Candidatus Thorarchaeota archaeon]
MLNDDRGLNITIGTDIVEIDRFRNLEAESPFYGRVFSERELAYCHGYPDPAPHFAATFAGKEAVVKATDSNCRATIGTVEILRDENGAPNVMLHQSCNHDIYVSLSHSSSHAVAVALAVHQSYSSDLNEIQGLLEITVKRILPRSEVS